MAPAHYDHKDSTNVRSRNNFLIGQYVRELSMCNKLIFFFLRPSFDTLCSNRVRGYEMHRGQRWNRGRGWRRYGLRRFADSQLRNHLYLNISPQLHTVTLFLCKNPAPCIKQSSYTYFEDTLALHTLVMLCLTGVGSCLIQFTSHYSHYHSISSSAFTALGY